MTSWFSRRRPEQDAIESAATGYGRRVGRVMPAAFVALLAACSSTGESFNTAGLNRIVTGRTTMEQASGYLGAQPVDVWQQGDTTLARWAYKGTIATDAVYFRQEAWLRFGPDGLFQRMEHSVNLPLKRHPRTAAEADREAQAEQERIAREAPPRTVVVQSAPESAPPPAAEPAGAAIEPASLAIPAPAAPAAQPLLPAGTKVIPGVTYPVRKPGR
ncbi:MAG: hypothetical protein RBR29_10440 [Castellaniella sp.]|uniref:hypothetical protein n=1 Tax=Castellaniella sp. TaxID=1955812 RepID=UPI002A36FEDD|nr:hypothetical protein [Castellaniella sp.]MDY0310187.1 hypothetical protein [Castellaniella sp.]